MWSGVRILFAHGRSAPSNVRSQVGSKPNPGVITTMKYGNPFLRPSNPFTDRDCIAMVEYLKTQPTILTSITRIDLTQSTKRKIPG